MDLPLRVIKARHGSIVDRKRRHHKTTSIAHSHLPDAPTSKELKIDMMTEGQNSTSHRVYPQIKLTQTVDTFRRPLSPSDRMVDLSKRLSSKPHEDVSIGTPPSERTGTTLARKVQSELNISELMGDEIVDTSSASVNSDFSTGDAGDLLPDEMLTVPCVDPLSSTERELLIALQELAVLIARRRDIDVEMFVEDIMALMQAPRKKVTKTSQSPRNLPAVNTSVGTESKNLDDTPRATLRNFQPHPQIKFPLQRRHFSFEPGEDDLRALREGMSATKPAVSVTEFPAEHRPYSLRDRYRPVSPTAVPSLPKQMPVLEFGKHSKIPSPVQPLGRVRSIHRESSISSMHSTLTSPTDERRESRSSTFTALRNDSSGDLQSGSTSGKTSPYTSSLRSQRGHTHVRNSVAVIAAARAVELMDRTILDQEGSPRTSGATAMVGSPSRLARDLGTSGPENDRP